MLSKVMEFLILHLLQGVHRAAAGRAERRRTSALPSPVPQATKDADVVVGDSRPSRLAQIRSGAGRGAPEALPVALTVAERRTQMYVHGSTGTGKSVLLTTLLDADIEAGRGVVLLDARGDLVDRVLLRLSGRYEPGVLRERLVLLDLRRHAPYQAAGGDTHCVGFNPLREAGADPYASAFFTFDALAAQFDPGVQTAEILRNCLLALALSTEPTTLLDVEPLLYSAPFRKRILASVTDAGVRRFFEKRLPDLLQTPQYAASILNRLSPYTSVPALRRLLGMRTGSLSFRDLMESRPDAIVLCCLGGDELHSGAGLIGSLLISAVAKAVMRSDRSPARRKETTFLYCDEFENFGAAGKLFEEIISEGRRFGLGAILAHQSTAQLEPRLRSLIRNIVGVQAYFACGGSDSDTLAGELPSELPRAVLRNQLISLPVGDALLLRRGKPLLHMHTRYAPDPDVPARAVAMLRRESLQRWGRPSGVVDAEITAEAGKETGTYAGTINPTEIKKARGTATVTESAGSGIETTETMEMPTVEVRDVPDSAAGTRKTTGSRAKSGARKNTEATENGK